MTDKPKIDLSNVGGHPKDWFDKARDHDSQFSEWDDLKFTLGPILLVILLLASAAGVIYGFSQIGR